MDKDTKDNGTGRSPDSTPPDAKDEATTTDTVGSRMGAKALLEGEALRCLIAASRLYAAVQLLPHGLPMPDKFDDGLDGACMSMGKAIEHMRMARDAVEREVDGAGR